MTKQDVLIKKAWNSIEYQNFITYLKSLQDVKYKEFHSGLVLGSRYEMIGIRVPIMREIAKEIVKGNREDFLKYVQNHYYEEVMIQGFVIATFQEEKTFYPYFQKHIPKIDNWALCDSFCSAIKIVKKNKEKYFQESLQLALRSEEFMARVGIVMLLNHFISQENLETIFQTLNQMTSNQFYVNMAQAWLICELYIHFPFETTVFLKSNTLNAFTQNKAISKIHDSYRVSAEEKEQLKLFRK